MPPKQSREEVERFLDSLAERLPETTRRQSGEIQRELAVEAIRRGLDADLANRIAKGLAYRYRGGG